MQSYSKDDVRKISRTSTGSYYVILPKRMVEDLEWKEKQKIKVKKGRGELVIRDWKKK